MPARKACTKRQRVSATFANPRALKIEQIHDVAYRCKNAEETVEFYRKVLNTDFLMAMAEASAPATLALVATAMTTAAIAYLARVNAERFFHMCHSSHNSLLSLGPL